MIKLDALSRRDIQIEKKQNYKNTFSGLSDNSFAILSDLSFSICNCSCNCCLNKKRTTVYISNRRQNSKIWHEYNVNRNILTAKIPIWSDTGGYHQSRRPPAQDQCTEKKSPPLNGMTQRPEKFWKNVTPWSPLGFFFVVRLSRSRGKGFFALQKISACGGLLPVKFPCRALVAHYPLRDSATKKTLPPPPEKKKTRLTHGLSPHSKPMTLY